MEALNPMKIKPMGMMSSLMFFAVPSTIFSFCIYYVMQKLQRHGVNDFVNFFASMVAPLLLMTIAALVAFKIEGHSLKWPDIAARFRLNKMTKLDWIYAIGLLVVTIIIYESLSFTSKWLILNGALLRAGLVDEVSLVVHPLLVGGPTPVSFFRAPDLPGFGGAIPCKLKQFEKLPDDILWLVYEMTR